MLNWLVRMLRNCTSERYAINKSRMLRLSDYARLSLAELRTETGITYDERMQGTLQLFRTQAQLDASAKDVKALKAELGPLYPVYQQYQQLRNMQGVQARLPYELNLR